MRITQGLFEKDRRTTLRELMGGECRSSSGDLKIQEMDIIVIIRGSKFGGNYIHRVIPSYTDIA